MKKRNLSTFFSLSSLRSPYQKVILNS